VRSLPVVVSVLMGCTASQATPPADVRDSAGIRIAENPSPVYEVVPWRVAATPTVRIGGDEVVRPGC
jgi:hypothetical protein